MYHYAECGLRNVWLRDGYREVDTPHGKVVVIANKKDLHRVIAEGLIRQPYLTGREFRFLRTQLDMSQRDVGALLGKQAQTVASWEKKSRVPKYADLFIRLYFSNTPTRDAVTEYERNTSDRFDPEFQFNRDQWRFQAA